MARPHRAAVRAAHGPGDRACARPCGRQRYRPGAGCGARSDPVANGRVRPNPWRSDVGIRARPGRMGWRARAVRPRRRRSAGPRRAVRRRQHQQAICGHGGDAAGARRLAVARSNGRALAAGQIPHGDHIAVRHLLSHTSGVRDYLDESFAEAALADHSRVWAPRELVSSAITRRPSSAIGGWRYANTNYVLLGLIVEQVTHNSLTRELHQRIIDPLGLSHTFVTPDDPLPGNLMHGYEGQRDETMDRDMSFPWGTGNIISNVEDLSRFATALFGGARLRPASLTTMQTFIGTRGLDSPDLTYGLGVMQTVLHAARPAVARDHTGALIGYRTAL